MCPSIQPAPSSPTGLVTASAVVAAYRAKAGPPPARAAARQMLLDNAAGRESVEFHEEIARMLSGESYSAEALALARRLLTGE